MGHCALERKLGNLSSSSITAARDIPASGGFYFEKEKS
jgi:hypothetical protein